MNFIKRISRSTTPPSSTRNPSANCVRFNDLPSVSSDREKYLTAKYPQQQMQLIRKRLDVEFWLDEQLRFLYNIQEENCLDDHEHCPGDLIDSLLDIDDDFDRRTFLLEKLRHVKQSRSITLAFIEEFLQRVKTL